MWDRNLQLAFWSSLIYAPIMFYDNPRHPFQGWSVITMGCAAVGALGGVLVALSIKYTDSIMKTIATTGSIVLTTVLNAAFLQGPFTLPIWAGGLIVVVSVFNYNDNGDPAPRPSTPSSATAKLGCIPRTRAPRRSPGPPPSPRGTTGRLDDRRSSA